MNTTTQIIVSKSDTRSQILGEEIRLFLEEQVDDYVNLIRKTFPTINIKRKICQITN